MNGVAGSDIVKLGGPVSSLGGDRDICDGHLLGGHDVAAREAHRSQARVDRGRRCPQQHRAAASTTEVVG